MHRDLLRSVLSFCAERLPRKSDRRIARLADIAEKLQELDQEERIRLDPFAKEFLAAYGFFVDPTSIPWGNLDNEDLGDLAAQLELIRPKRPQIHEPILVSDTKLLPIVTRRHEVLAEVITTRLKSLRLTWEG